MWEMIKNDPLLKTITILILGVLGFGFAFQIMFGPGVGGMDQGMNSGFTLGYTLMYAVAIMVKILVLLIVAAAIIAVFKGIRKYVVEGSEWKMPNTIKNDPILKVTTAIVAIILTIAFVHILIGGVLGFGSMGMNSGYMMNGGAMFGLTGILVLVTKLLLLASVVGFIVGIVLFGKEYYMKSMVKTGNKENIDVITVDNDFNEKLEI